MSSGVIDILVDMGFSISKAEKALEITGNKGVEPAMEWLLAHSDEAEPAPEPSIGESAPALAADTPIQDNVASASNQLVSTTDTAKSMKCDVCGKLFKSNLEVEFHATKSGHDRFSESTEEKKPLTEEEKREQLKMLEEKLRQKRKEREEQEKKDALEREKNRIRSGKEMSEARKKLEELEMKKLLEQRKREKAEEKEARERVRAQIEADKAARRAKANAAENDQSVNTSVNASASLSAITSSTSMHHRKDYTETRLQLRLTNGQTLTQSFGSKEQLSAVRLFIEMNRTDGNGPFQLMTTFPKKVFTDEDYDTPLDVLGLVPSAVVIVQKKVE
ncbi:UBX domain-containing protein 1-A [Cataglyphis hispanica]|uniref:UBX domain-containing protein 1-A n=1 Tax=Cataglyphis hispanica TaxID=1086592 RepID=UPI00217F5284|nr:UBX domain-containing protein 1-A [Cataglyphis hispanica]